MRGVRGSGKGLQVRGCTLTCSASLGPRISPRDGPMDELEVLDLVRVRVRVRARARARARPRPS